MYSLTYKNDAADAGIVISGNLTSLANKAKEIHARLGGEVRIFRPDGTCLNAPSQKISFPGVSGTLKSV